MGEDMSPILEDGSMGGTTQDDTRQRKLNATFVGVAIHLGVVFALLYWAFILVRPFISIVVWGVVLSVALYPTYNWLRRNLGDRPRLAAAIMTVIGLLIVLGPATWMAIDLFEGSKILIRQVESGAWTIPPPPLKVRDWPLVGHSLYEFWMSASTNAQSALANLLPQLRPAGTVALETLGSAGAGTLKFLVSVVLMGFLFSYGPLLVAAAKTLARKVDPTRGEQIVALSAATIRAVSRGVIGISLLQAIIGGAGMALAGVPFASLLTFAILVLGIVQIGPLIIVAPLGIWAWSNLPTLTAAGLTVCLAAVYFIEGVLKPFALSHGLTTPGLVIFVGVIGGILAHGIAGLFAGPIVLAVAWEVATAWIYADVGEPAAAEPTADRDF